MIRAIGNCFRGGREEDGGRRSRYPEYRAGRTRSTSNSEENQGVETEGPWRSFTRSISNAWNRAQERQRRWQREREASSGGTFESSFNVNPNPWGGFTYQAAFYPAPTSSNSGRSQEYMRGGHGSTPYRRTDQQPSSGAPPASDDAISRLPEVTFHGADLVADGDKSCPICLEQHRVGGKGVRLPCGHCFHAFCVRPWLEKHCMCPVCRFEIPTSDSEYEWSRRQRMKSRKRRVRLSELEGYSIKQLRGLATELSINLSTAIEKRDVVEAISSSHQVEIVAEAAEPCFGMRNESSFPTAYGGNSQGVQSTSRPMEDLPIGELLGIAKVHGLNIKGCTEKHDLICIIRDAGIR